MGSDWSSCSGHYQSASNDSTKVAKIVGHVRRISTESRIPRNVGRCPFRFRNRTVHFSPLLLSNGQSSTTPERQVLRPKKSKIHFHKRRLMIS